jgi:tetratricopeptide (TPR) repeat protein
LSKRKGKKRRASRPPCRGPAAVARQGQGAGPGDRGAPGQRPPATELQQALDLASSLLDRGRSREAIELLEPLVASYPRVAELHYQLGYARVEAGDLWGGLAGYEQALELSRDADYWLPLASLYLELELNAHALRAFRQVLKQGDNVPLVDSVRATVAALEQNVVETAHRRALPVAQMEKALIYLEEGQCALQLQDFPACIAANRRAIRLLADWPPPRNNLSLALFFDGQPEEAIATARQVLARAPDNVQALSNAIRFLAWTGQEEEAQALWAQLQEITPQDNGERLKMAEAAAILNRDEGVCALLQPLDQPGAAAEGGARSVAHAQLLLAVAEANLGKRAARRRLEALQGRVPWAGEFLTALESGRPGPGWAERFPYFHSTELMPARRIEEFIELARRQDEMSPRRFREQMTRFVARFPQIVRLAEKLIWEESQLEAGIAILGTVATPAAYAALRRFGLSQAGEDEARIQALFSLAQAGEIAPDETLRVWSRGEWREVQLRQYEISGEREAQYAPQVMELLNQGLQAFQGGDHDQAERLFRRALKQEPRAKEAYNNLGTLYARRGEHERAREMYRAALEIDPLYVFPRCNLAIYLLDEDDVEGARTMLTPLANATRFHAQDMAFYSYTQARILVQSEEYEAARGALQAALEVWPGYKPAEELLEWLDTYGSLMTGFEPLMERQQERDRARRARLQTRLSTAEPSLSEALSLYSKEALTGTARVALPWGGWSALRKAELLQEVVAGLRDPDNLEGIVADLTAEERAALRQVLARGGDMPWGDFDAAYGNDLEESPYWQWHVPETIMGRLRLCGLLAEATVDGELLVTVPSELRRLLRKILR